MNRPRIIVEVVGGLVSVVHSSVDISVDILDYDNMKQETDEEELKRMRALVEEVKTLPHGY